ncbi:hypothetical protein [Nocardia nova]|uniref:hypothetical protein n=1 Tax=Nocardia nova TaxID=37330 RepID=UPI0033EF35D2
MVVPDVVMVEIAKALTASMAGAGIKGAGRLVQLIKRRFGDRSDVLPESEAQWHDFLIRCADEDPELYEQVVTAVLEGIRIVPRERDLAVFTPPLPFCDRDELRAALPRHGVFGFSGPRGCGKTALVQQLAVERSEDFPVFRIRIDLDEFRVGDVLQFSEVKRRVLRQLGIDDIATGERELSGQYRAVLATRRPMLVVIENLLAADEFEELIETWSETLVLVTTRALTEDLRGCSPRWFELGGLEIDGARALLAQRVPESVLKAEAATVDTLLSGFGRHPHAVRLLGAVLSRRVGEPRPVAGLLAEFDELGIDEVDTLLGAVVSGQVDEVPDGMREAFRLLALCPAGLFTIETANILLGYRSRPVVDTLRELGLIEVLGDGRYRMSWSIRRFADGLGAVDGGVAALDRLLDHYVGRAVAADLAGGRRLRYYRVPELERWPESENRIGWLDAEAEVLSGLVEYAYRQGRDDAVGQLCGALEVLSLHRGRYALCLAAFERGVRAARRQQAPALLARQHALCGRMATMMHRFEFARAELDTARAIAAELADPALESSVWEFVGRLAEEQAGAAAEPDWRHAIDAYSRAVAIDRRTDAREARGLHTRMLANVLVKTGPAAEIPELLAEARAFTSGDRNLSRVCTVWAKYLAVLGELSEARGQLAEARRLAAEAGAEQYRVELDDLEADIAYRDRDYPQARRVWAALAQAFVEQGHPRATEFFVKLSWIPPGT